MATIINASTSAGLIQTADTSGTLQLQSNGVTQQTVDSTGSYGQLKQGTAQASTSGTSITFSSIPSWVKRITVIFNGVSTNGTSNPLIQIGSGSVTITGYVADSMIGTTGVSNTAFTSGFGIAAALATNALSGVVTLYLLGSNTWIASGMVASSINLVTGTVNGTVTLSGTLDRIVVTTVNGTDTFDAGSINIFWE